MARVFGIFLCLCLFSVSLIPFFSLVAIPLYRIHVSKNWSATPCLITSSTVEKKEKVAKNGRSSFLYWLHVEYAFSVDSVRLLGEEFNPSRMAVPNREELEPYLAEFHAGSRCSCYVNPENPRKSYLTIDWLGIPPGRKIDLVLCLPVTVLSGYLAFRLIRNNLAFRTL